MWDVFELWYELFSAHAEVFPSKRVEKVSFPTLLRARGGIS